MHFPLLCNYGTMLEGEAALQKTLLHGVHVGESIRKNIKKNKKTKRMPLILQRFPDQPLVYTRPTKAHRVVVSRLRCSSLAARRPKATPTCDSSYVSS